MLTDIVADAAPSDLIWVAVFLAIAMIAAWVLGVFRCRSIAGPTRLAADQPAAPVGMALCLGILAFIFGSSLPLLGVKSDNIPDSAQIHSQLLGPAFALVMVLVTWTNWRQIGISVGQLPLGFLKALAAIFVVAPLMMAATMGTEWMLDHFNYQGERVHQALTLLGKDTVFRQRVEEIAAIIIAAPLSEELIFRGCLQTLLSRFMGRWGAVVLTSLLFALIHPGWWMWAPIFVLALCLGYVYERTGNLWTSIFIHSLFNVTGVINYLVSPQAVIHWR